MKVKDLSGDLLTQWVSKAIEDDKEKIWVYGWEGYYGWESNRIRRYKQEALDLAKKSGGEAYKIEMDYSTDWSSCGPLLEKFRITLYELFPPDMSGSKWRAQARHRSPNGSNLPKMGRTPQEALCRAVVGSVFGEEIEE